MEIIQTSSQMMQVNGKTLMVMVEEIILVEIMEIDSLQTPPNGMTQIAMDMETIRTVMSRTFAPNPMEHPTIL